jgi:hypothetical protein
MNCFNHPVATAVAECDKCKKGLCVDCAKKYPPVLCDVHGEAWRKEQSRNTFLIVFAIVLMLILCVKLFHDIPNLLKNPMVNTILKR